MRAYFFGNMYLSSIQQGIQAAHTIVEMYEKYYDDRPRKDQIYDWAQEHKTMILLNGGYSVALHDLINFFNHRENDFPYAKFNEGEDALDGALTCVGIILPERIYNTAAGVRNQDSDIDIVDLYAYGEIVDPEKYNLTDDTIDKWEFSKWEVDLIANLNTFGMAR